MKKLKYLIKYGLKKRLFTKAFYISSAIIGVLIVAITLLPTIIGMFAEEPGSEAIEGRLTIVDTTGYQLDDRVKTTLETVLNGSFDNQFEVVYTPDVPDISFYENAEDGEGLVYIYLEDNLVGVQLYDKGLPGVVVNFLNVYLKELQRIKYDIDN